MKNMSRLLDANAILRYLLNDIPDQASEVEQAINHSSFTIGEVIAEVVYVLQGVYKLERSETTNALVVFLDEIDIADKPVVKEALHEYAATSLDYVDCVLYSRAKLLGETILSFDKKLNKKISEI